MRKIVFSLIGVLLAMGISGCASSPSTEDSTVQSRRLEANRQVAQVQHARKQQEREAQPPRHEAQAADRRASATTPRP